MRKKLKRKLRALMIEGANTPWSAIRAVAAELGATEGDLIEVYNEPRTREKCMAKMREALMLKVSTTGTDHA
jgi:hypothetical protein